jgi:hypothetical protein
MGERGCERFDMNLCVTKTRLKIIDRGQGSYLFGTVVVNSYENYNCNISLKADLTVDGLDCSDE